MNTKQELGIRNKELWVGAKTSILNSVFLILAFLFIFILNSVFLILPSVAHAATSNVATSNAGLVGYWTLDGNQTNWTTGFTKDSSGNGDNGSLIGGIGEST